MCLSSRLSWQSSVAAHARLSGFRTIPVSGERQGSSVRCVVGLHPTYIPFQQWYIVTMATSHTELSSGTATVLIADDEPSVRAAIRAVLKPLSLDCLEAADGFEAMDLLETRHPDLLIVDYAMPGWDGLEILRHLRRDPSLTKTKVIFISGYADLKMFYELTSSHMVHGVLEKPCDPRKLLWQVRMLLRIRRDAPTERGTDEPRHPLFEWGRMLGNSTHR
jgi:CheY-like chemotaxis protein